MEEVKTKGKKLLAAFLLGVGLCFVPTLGYGKVEHRAYEVNASYMDFCLLNARVTYMMYNPTNFLNVEIYYDPEGERRRILEFPESIDTKGKILVVVFDSRGAFSYKSEIALLDHLKKELEVICSFIAVVATNMNTDIVAQFRSREGIPLGYFYQGEYHLGER